MKFRGRWSWCNWFGEKLGERLPPARSAIVTPIPLHWSRRLSRGFDQSAMLAQSIAERAGLPYLPTLRRVRRTDKQADLDSFKARNENVRKAFAPRSPGPLDLTGTTVFLIDDVKTTGHTSRRCARLLKQMNAEKVILVTIAVAKHEPYQPRPV